jgi:hypothetical protein
MAANKTPPAKPTATEVKSEVGRKQSAMSPPPGEATAAEAAMATNAHDSSMRLYTGACSGALTSGCR